MVGARAYDRPVFVCYDIRPDRERKKVFEACRDRGLKNIQYSVFYGMLNRKARESLFSELCAIVPEGSGTLFVIPLEHDGSHRILCYGEPLGMGQPVAVRFV